MKFRALIAIATSSLAMFANAQQTYLLSAMPGYKEKVQKVVAFGQFSDLDQFFCKQGAKCTSADPGFDEQGRLAAEGKVTFLEYSANGKPAGTLAVFRNYDHAIRQAGGRMLTYSSDHEGTHVYLLDQPQKKTWIVLTNAYDSQYQIAYVEAQPMQQVVKVNELENAIEKSGFATLYINFANNKSELPADAAPGVQEVVKLLKKQPAWRLSVDGHTDNVGSTASNKTLSQSRAASVMKALTAGGIAANRLSAKGFGSEVPIADNRTDEGRAKNRRVELVRAK